MPRRYLKRVLPKPDWVRNHPHLSHLGERLHDPNLWHLNRHSVAGALALGVFIAFLPIPGQFILAGLLALWLRVNLPLAVISVFITNPLTMAPVYYFNYRVGALLLGRPPVHWQLDWTWQALGQDLAQIWLPLLLGSLVMGALAAIAAYLCTLALWRIQVLLALRARRRRRE